MSCHNFMWGQSTILCYFCSAIYSAAPVKILIADSLKFDTIKHSFIDDYFTIKPLVEDNQCLCFCGFLSF